MTTDQIFTKPSQLPFSFNGRVAEVFDDMATRSIPEYDILQKDVAKITARFAKPGTNVYDLGCSTATTLLNVEEQVDSSVTLVGVDNSKEMLAQAMKKTLAGDSDIKLVHSDFTKEHIVDNASVVSMLWTLMFVRPIHRHKVIKNIYDGLNPGGVFILIEKILGETPETNQIFMDNYYDHKRSQGYSEDEILNKRLALENVLVPFKNSENLELLQDFGHVEVFFRDKQFAGYLAIKGGSPNTMQAVGALKKEVKLETNGKIAVAKTGNEMLIEPVAHKAARVEKVISLNEETRAKGLPVELGKEGPCHKFPYQWTISGLKVKMAATDKKCMPKVMSTFACGGGSSFGYKLAGCNVIASNEFDKKKNDIYLKNHNVKYNYPEMIQITSRREDFPDELYNLDILDGSPPCKEFSMNGKREKAWGTEREYKKGTGKQVLSELFFDFIRLVKKLQPKVVVAENVKGLTHGNAKKIVIRIFKAFDDAGYFVRLYKLNAADFGVPQRRNRVFFVAVRKDLAPYIDESINPSQSIDYTSFDGVEDHKLIKLDQLDTVLPALDFGPAEKHIPFGEIEQADPKEFKPIVKQSILELWEKLEPGNNFTKVHPKGNWFNKVKVSVDKVLPTILPNAPMYHYDQPRHLSKKELEFAGTWPTDYDYGTFNPHYLIGRSVPPVLMAHIVTAIKEQYLEPINKGLNIILNIPTKEVKTNESNSTPVMLKNEALDFHKQLVDMADYSQFPKPNSSRSPKRYYYHRYFLLKKRITRLGLDKDRADKLYGLKTQFVSVPVPDQQLIYQTLESFYKVFKLKG